MYSDMEDYLIIVEGILEQLSTEDIDSVALLTKSYFKRMKACLEINMESIEKLWKLYQKNQEEN